MLRHRYYSNSNLNDGRSSEHRVRCTSDGSQQEMQKYPRDNFRRPALLPKTERGRGNRNPPLLMVKPIKRYEDDRVQNFRNDVKV